MFKSVCRTGDIVTGVCLNHDDPQPFTGVWGSGSLNVIANGIGIIREGDTGNTNCGHIFVANGSSSDDVTANGLSLQRIGDTVTVIGGGNGTSITGSPDVNSL
jgi:hypothetical protein